MDDTAISTPIRVLLADDHPLLRVGLKETLQESPDCEAVGEAETADETLNLAKALQPDLVVLDVRLKGKRIGIDILNELRAAAPGVKIVVLSNYYNEPYVRAALEAGAHAYLLKDATPEEILEAIRVVMRGNTVLSERVSAAIVRAYVNAAADASLMVKPLTTRETQILQLLVDGRTNDEIANTLGFAVKSVQGYLTSLYEKLDARNRTEAVVKAARRGLIVIGGAE